MRTTSVTGIPIRDLKSAQAWYAKVFERGHDLEPAEGSSSSRPTPDRGSS
jgi:hypothetical protein